MCTLNDTIESCAIEIRSNELCLIILAIYRPPTGTENFIIHLLDLFISEMPGTIELK